ncbi:Tea1 transcription factor [Candida orthopsilosis Co 90-125]|uniref:Tea1 transcription factor n=1 Tax=Candida orthopsilosis (strain 90-125) TaxID=1136231 RepID=H8X332_CANO9|nr:Tea1 transcription factor [Candida orthopsilosis Co 90-125]CCG25892.1 Tea1 transcription factor [Candida orthopsilosis Co 90-125]
MPEERKKRRVKAEEEANPSPPISASTVSTHNRKKLSCQQCRSRKIKCDGNSPCSGCIKAAIQCIPTVNDMRKKRIPVNYVQKLESQINNIRKFITDLRALDTEKQLEKLKDTDLIELVDTEPEAPTSNYPNTPSQDLQDDVEENKVIYGPTSVYDNHIIANSKRPPKRENEVAIINKLNKDPDILKCIQLFFTWQYPDHNMFIFREAFLIDFFDPKPTSIYCSKTLILSICALGSRMSDEERTYRRSKEFYQESKSILLSTLSQPSIASLQSFMVLAFFDICNGSNSSGWMLSGNAMRMGFDIGFQLNPKVWFVKSKESLNPLDVEIRSRIYWGCYMADHFISLVLGRPSILKMADSSIPETADLPDLEWIDDFTYDGFIKKKRGLVKNRSRAVSYIGDPLNQIINLINISDNMLNDIFTKSDLENDQTNEEELDLESRLEKLFEYNAQIQQWKQNLPEDLQWNNDSLASTGENPTYSGIRYYYYILLLCLNRPFVGLESEKLKSDNHLSPLTICLNVIEDLYVSIYRFEQVHGYRRASIFVVYSSILSISIILLTNSNLTQVNQHRDRLQFFMSVLHGCSKTWKLAEKSYNLIKDKLKHRYETGELNERETKSSSSNFTTSDGAPTTSSNSSVSSVPIVRDIPSIKQSPMSSVDSQNFTNTDVLLDDNIDFLGGPPVLMTSDLFNEDWESLFPDYIFHSKN